VSRVHPHVGNEHIAEVTDPLLARLGARMHLAGAPEPGEPVLALVSGGPDSTLLMHLLASAHDGPVTVLTLDHGLRPAAAAECAAVMAAAASLGLAARTERLGLGARPGLQARAREARYATARRVAAETGSTAIAVGHTLSDQAETVLMRIARGTGRTGAVGMAARSGDLVRPLLGVAAEEARAWCVEHGLPVAADPSNADAAFTRVRARELLRDLEGLHPGAQRHVAAFAAGLGDEDALLRELVDEAWERCAPDGALSAAALGRERMAMRRLLVRRLLAGHGLGGDALSAPAVARVLALVDGPARAEVPGAAVVREGGVLRLIAPGPAEPPAEALLVPPGEVRFGAVRLRASSGPAAPPRPDRVAIRGDGPLRVRSPRPGDRLGLPGGGRARVGRLLAADGVPARLRPLVPVVERDGRPLWVAGHRADPGALAAPGEDAMVLEVVTA